jgi:large subunit ribosomal protein L10
MANAEKVAAVAEITGRFRAAQAAVLTEYRGLSMAQLTELRHSLGRQTTYAVVKNTLTKRAAADAGVADLAEWLSGPTAIAFINGDPVEAAKGLRAFARTHPMLVIKGGLFEGRMLTADEVTKIADLESREVVLARLAGAMKGNLAQAAGLFTAPMSQVARLAAALQDKRAAEQPASAAAEDAVGDAAEDAAAAPATG